MSVSCPQCNLDNVVKNGFVKGRQRFKCKDCQYQFTNLSKERGKPLWMKLEAVLLYMSGMSMNATAKLLGVSAQSVLNWVRDFGEANYEKPTPDSAIVVELIVAIYCLCDDLLQALHYPSDPQQQMSDAEVMTTAIVAALYFHGNFELARHMLFSPLYILRMLSRSHFNRRLHRLRELFVFLFRSLAEVWKNLNQESVYIIDSFPIVASENCRARRGKIYQGNSSYWGYQSSKKRFFYGIKVHLMVSQKGEPVEFFLSPASFSDVKSLEVFSFDIKEGSVVYGDKAYNDYDIEDWLEEGERIKLLPLRKKNSKRQVPPYVEFVQRKVRKMIETAGSLLTQLLPKSIHAVTSEGFELKVMLFLLALSVHFWVAT